MTLFSGGIDADISTVSFSPGYGLAITIWRHAISSIINIHNGLIVKLIGRALLTMFVFVTLVGLRGEVEI